MDQQRRREAVGRSTRLRTVKVARPPWKLYDGIVDKMKATTIRRSSGLSRSSLFVRCLKTSPTIATFAMLSSERHIPGASRSRKSASSTGLLRIASSFSLTLLSKTSTIGSATQVACFPPLAGGIRQSTPTAGMSRNMPYSFHSSSALPAVGTGSFTVFPVPSAFHDIISLISARSASSTGLL